MKQLIQSAWEKLMWSFLIRRFTTMERWVQKAFYICFPSILLIELYLKNIISSNNLIFHVGEIYLRICYSITASIIFFFINQHLPKEKKKVKTWQYVREKIIEIKLESTYLLRNLNIDIGISDAHVREAVDEACSNIDINGRVGQIEEGAEKFHGWLEYLTFKSNRYHILITELFLVEEVVSPGIAEKVLEIDSIISRFKVKCLV